MASDGFWLHLAASDWLRRTWRAVPSAPPEQVPSHVARGCIIGGTALVDGTLAGRPYPNTVTLTQRTKYLEWSVEELRQAMKEDKSVEAAVSASPDER